MISVIIPYVKDRGYLNEALESLYSQTFEDFEIVLIQGDCTQGENINRGVELAKGKYIKILHDDDTLPPNALQDLHDGIQGYDWVCGDAVTFGDPMYCPDPKRYAGCIPTLEKMVEENRVFGGTTMYKKEYVFYDEDLPTGEEYEFHLWLLSWNTKVNYIPKVVHNYRLHKFNKSYYMGPGEKKRRREFIKKIASWYK